MPALQRVHDWPERLHRIIASAREVPFQWGRFDCALHVCNCIKAMTGDLVDPGAGYRGTYSTEAGADAIFLAGFSNLGDFAASIAATYSMPEVGVNYARRGDLVWVDNGTTYGALAIVGLDGRFATCASSAGLAHVRIQRWRRAWQVG